MFAALNPVVYALVATLFMGGITAACAGGRVLQGVVEGRILQGVGTVDKVRQATESPLASQRSWRSFSGAGRLLSNPEIDLLSTRGTQPTLAGYTAGSEAL